jgi:putative thioredoxin
MLGPVLEKVTTDLAGKVELVKVNTDEAPAVAARYGIRSIPDVRLFDAGREAGGFVGAQPEPRVRAFLDEHLPSGTLRQALAGAEAAFYARDFARAAELARSLPASHKDWDRLQAIAELADAAARPPAAGDAVAARHAEAIAKVVAQDAPAGLEILLELVGKHRKWGDDAARKTMLAVFQLIGQRSDVSDEYRRRLSLLL